MLSILSYVSGPSVCPPWRSVCSSPLPIFNWVVCLPGVESCEFFIYFGDQTFVLAIIGKYVFPYCSFSFHFNAVFFSHTEAFYFDEVPFVYSFCYVPCSRGHICECRLVQPLWKTVWNFLKILKMELPFDPAIPLLGLYPKNPKTPT